MMWPFYLKLAYHMYNSLEIDEDGKTPEQKFSGADFQTFPTDYHAWGCPVSFLEAPLQGGPTGLPTW